MKLYVVDEETDAFDVIVGTKNGTDSTIRLSVFDYSTGILKYVIPKRWEISGAPDTISYVWSYIILDLCIFRFSFLMHSWSVTERGGKNFLAGINATYLSVYNLKTKRLNKE